MVPGDIPSAQLMAAIKAVGAQTDDDEDLFQRQYAMARRAGLSLDALDRIVYARNTRNETRKTALAALVAQVEARLAALQG